MASTTLVFITCIFICWSKACCNQQQSYFSFQSCLCRVWSALTGQLRVDSAQGQEVSVNFWTSPYLTIYTAVTVWRPLWRAQAWPKTLYFYLLKRHSKLGQTIFGRGSILQMILHQQNVCNLGEVGNLDQIWLGARE